MFMENNFDASVSPTQHQDSSLSMGTTRGSILLVEDEAESRRLLRTCLERDGYEVVEAMTGREAVDLLGKRVPSAVLLAMSLPDMDSFGLLTRLREWTQIPILALSEHPTEEEEILALDSGANDYLAKPIRTGELLARIRVTQRHVKHAAQPRTVFRSGDLTVDLASRTVCIKDKRAKLTPTEYSLIRLFVQNAGKVLTHSQIFREVWGSAKGNQFNYIRVYLSRIRNKLARELIVTEPGIGYRLAPFSMD